MNLQENVNGNDWLFIVLIIPPQYSCVRDIRVLCAYVQK